MKPTQKNQSGVTLLLAILVLAGLVLVAAAVSVFTVQEIRSSRATLLTEPAYSAAEAGTELGLWNLKREDPATLKNCDSGPALQNLGNNNISKVVVCKSFRGQEFIVGTSDTTFFLYDPDDVNGNVDLLSYPYTFLSVDNNGAFSVQVDIFRIDDTPVLSGQVDPGFSELFNIPAVPPGSEGRLRVTLSAADFTSVFVDTNKGLPDNMAIISSGCSAKTAIVSCNDLGKELFNRKIEVELND